MPTQNQLWNTWKVGKFRATFFHSSSGVSCEKGRLFLSSCGKLPAHSPPKKNRQKNTTFSATRSHKPGQCCKALRPRMFSPKEYARKPLISSLRGSPARWRIWQTRRVEVRCVLVGFSGVGFETWIFLHLVPRNGKNDIFTNIHRSVQGYESNSDFCTIKFLDPPQQSGQFVIYA